MAEKDKVLRWRISLLHEPNFSSPLGFSLTLEDLSPTLAKFLFSPLESILRSSEIPSMEEKYDHRREIRQHTRFVLLGPSRTDMRSDLWRACTQVEAVTTTCTQVEAVTTTCTQVEAVTTTCTQVEAVTTTCRGPTSRTIQWYCPPPFISVKGEGDSHRYSHASRTRLESRFPHMQENYPKVPCNVHIFLERKLEKG